MKDSKEIQEIIDDLNEKIEEIHKTNGAMDEASYGYEQGVIITGNTAMYLVETLGRIVYSETDDRLLDGTSLLVFMRQYTEIEDKGLMNKFLENCQGLVHEYFTDIN